MEGAITMKTPLLFLILVTIMTSTAQSSFIPRTVLGNLAGCFKVIYRFVETKNYQVKYKPIKEWIRTAHTSNLLVFEHIGQYPTYEKAPKPTEVAQYHWKEVWREMDGGKWEHLVTGPYRGFRYRCIGEWFNNQFHCEAPYAIKPRRDRRRKDYSRLNRINTIQITETLWIHAQRNFKYNQAGELIGSELGWNEYKRLPDSDCQLAIDSNAQPLK